MIEEKDLDSWEQLQDEVSSLMERVGESENDLLFRGQRNSGWELKTTAERALKAPIGLSEYYRFAYSAKPKLETFVDSTWEILTPPAYDRWLKEKDTLTFHPLPGYEYLAYLRHHGFPSPFLDWTASPFVAAFFAFNRCEQQDGFVSFFAYLEHASGGKLRSSRRSAIYTYGPYVKVHRRHVLQQSEYSICVELDSQDQPIYSNHEAVLKRSDKEQDRLWKYNVPASERTKALKALHRMNINSFSLFGSEESLVESIATNEIIRKKL